MKLPSGVSKFQFEVSLSTQLRSFGSKFRSLGGGGGGARVNRFDYKTLIHIC